MNCQFSDPASSDLGSHPSWNIFADRSPLCAGGSVGQVVPDSGFGDMFVKNYYSDRFREFDFGNEEENMDEYGTPEPPEYRLVITLDSH